MKNMDHFSIDLETLGVRSSAAILSIGCQQFDADSGKLGATFYKEIEIDSALRVGSVNGDTLSWWVTQSKEAQRVFVRSNEKMALPTALLEFTTWMRTNSFAPIVWGNGATFDISILEHAYDHGCVGLKEAWHFTNIRDMRTLVDVAAFDKNNWPFPKDAVAHNALNDATRQAQIISAAWQKVRKGLGLTKAEVKRQELSEFEMKARTAKPLAPIVPEDDEL